LRTNLSALNIKSNDIVSMGDLGRIAGSPGPCITLLTAIPNPAEIRARLKNMLRTAQKELAQHGADGDLLLDPVQDLAATLEMDGSWANGLIVLRSPDMFRYWWLRGSFSETVAVAGRFQMRPLFALAATEQRFYLLAVSEKLVHLFRCTQHGMERVSVNVPQNMQDWLSMSAPDHDLQNRSTAGPSIGSMKGVTFGMSSDREREDEYLRHFLVEVEQGVAKALREDRAPLVLAGVEREVAHYRRVNTYPRLVDEAVPGSPDGVAEQELHGRAWSIVSRMQSEALRRAREEFDRQSNRHRVSTKPREVVKAAFEGRVADLFFRDTASFTGSWDAASAEVHESEGEDLVNAAAVETVRQGGRAFELSGAEMPVGEEIAAALRF
jgi:Bacterial archaeo-eukaryotic release factor family 3